MLHEKTGQYDRPDEVRTSSSYFPAQVDQEDPLNTISETDLENTGENFEIIRDRETITRIRKALKSKNCFKLQTRCILDEQQQRHVYDRLVLYRLRAHKLAKGEPDEQLDDETLKKELPDFLRTAPLFRLHFDMRIYFECLKEHEDGSVDWYFDPQISKLKHHTDYRRLVLTNHGNGEYLHWTDYRSNCTTYKLDKDYITYCDEISGKLQWLKDYIGEQGTDEWINIETRGFNQALMMTTKFPDMTLDLAYTAYREHIWSLAYDYQFREGWDSIFFTIWKLVTKEKSMFLPALREVSEMHLAARHKESILFALDYSSWFFLESKFDSCVKGIPHEAEDEVAEECIKKAVWELPKKKILHQYTKRKTEIAENIGFAYIRMVMGCRCWTRAQLECQNVVWTLRRGAVSRKRRPTVSLVPTQSIMKNVMVSNYLVLVHVG